MGDAMEDHDDNMDVEESGHEEVPVPVPSLVEEEAILKKKYGGLMPKKPPLISKDHERAFFDSADWALGKQGGAPPGQKPRTLMETLRPKLQPTPHQSLPSRRSSLLPADGEGEGEGEGEGGGVVQGEGVRQGALGTGARQSRRTESKFRQQN